MKEFQETVGNSQIHVLTITHQYLLLRSANGFSASELKVSQSSQTRNNAVTSRSVVEEGNTLPSSPPADLDHFV